MGIWNSKSFPPDPVESGTADGCTTVAVLTGCAESCVGTTKRYVTYLMPEEAATCIKHWALLFTFPPPEKPIRVEGLKRGGKLMGTMTCGDPFSGSGFCEERKGSVTAFYPTDPAFAMQL